MPTRVFKFDPVTGKASDPSGELSIDDEDDDTGTDPDDWMERIADALADHCGIELGSLEHCQDDPDAFAHLIEVAAANSKNRKANEKAKKVRMSQRAQTRRPKNDDAMVRSFFRHVGYNN